MAFALWLSSYSASPLDEEKLVEMVELEIAIALEESAGIWAGVELLAGATAELESGAGEEELSGISALVSALEFVFALEFALESALPEAGASCFADEEDSSDSTDEEDSSVEDSSSPISGAIESNAAELSSAHP